MSGSAAAGEIAARFPISGPSVSRHLAILRGAGLVREPLAVDRVSSSYLERSADFPPGSAVFDSAFLMSGLDTTWTALPRLRSAPGEAGT